MKIAIVGIKRKYQEISEEYRSLFNRFHLEIPYYYARDGQNDVVISTVDYEEDQPTKFSAGVGSLICKKEQFVRDEKFDVVIHWRAWNESLYKPEAINVMLSQDHSFSDQWQRDASAAFTQGKLYGILCFRTWHARNTLRECPWLTEERVILDTTFGVDTDVYYPSSDKNPYEMLWSSDPGRGLDDAILLALRLHQRDKRFKLHICYPDYVRHPQRLNHPALIWHGFVPAGEMLFDIFRTTGVLPYTSTFPEPSSRVHRQAQAAGSMVLYPKDMGTPSEVISHLETGIVSDIAGWADVIEDFVSSGVWKEISQRSRIFAVSEKWSVQAARFNDKMVDILKEM